MTGSSMPTACGHGGKRVHDIVAQHVAVWLALGPYAAHRDESRGVSDHGKQRQWCQEDEKEDVKSYI